MFRAVAVGLGEGRGMSALWLEMSFVALPAATACQSESSTYAVSASAGGEEDRCKAARPAVPSSGRAVYALEIQNARAYAVANRRALVHNASNGVEQHAPVSTQQVQQD